MMRLRMSSILAGMGLVVGLGGSTVASAGPDELRLYEMTTETGMPHLEENLRYAVRHERQCMSADTLSTAFWMLGDVSLRDCALVKSGENDTGADYALLCTGGHGTTGSAHWQFESHRMTGTLKVRLGGKNMSFYQRIVAKPVGKCG